jgi:hypothetical protein
MASTPVAPTGARRNVAGTTASHVSFSPTTSQAYGLPSTPPPPLPLESSDAGLHTMSKRGLASITAPSGRGSGQGPFLPAKSPGRALWGIQQTAQDLKVALQRIDPEACEHNPDRALLTGMATLLHAANQLQVNAKANVERLFSKAATVLDKTPKHKDPRNGLKGQLIRTGELAKEATELLEGHKRALEMHREIMHSRYADLALMNTILEGTVADEGTRSLTKSAPLSPPTPRSRSALSPPPAQLAPTAADRWKKVATVTHVAISLSPSSPRSTSTSTSVAPWSGEEDSVLLALLTTHGLHRWAEVAKMFPAELRRRGRAPPSTARVSGVCQARYEQLLNAFLSIGSVPGIRKTSDILLAARKSARDAEAVMNECAGTLTRARSELSMASVRQMRLVEKVTTAAYAPAHAYERAIIWRAHSL